MNYCVVVPADIIDHHRTQSIQYPAGVPLNCPHMTDRRGGPNHVYLESTAAPGAAKLLTKFYSVVLCCCPFGAVSARVTQDTQDTQDTQHQARPQLLLWLLLLLL